MAEKPKTRPACTGACYYSTGPASRCDCACGGEFHGKGNEPLDPNAPVSVIGGHALVPVGPGDSCPANSDPPGYIEAIDPVDGGPLGAPMTPERAVDHLTARSLAHNAYYELGEGADRDEVEAEVRRHKDALGINADDATVSEAVGFYERAYPEGASAATQEHERSGLDRESFLSRPSFDGVNPNVAGAMYDRLSPFTAAATADELADAAALDAAKVTFTDDALHFHSSDGRLLATADYDPRTGRVGEVTRAPDPDFDPYDDFDDDVPDHWGQGYAPDREAREPFLTQAHERRAAEMAARDPEVMDRLAACAEAHEDASGEFHDRVEDGWHAVKQMGQDDGGGQGVCVRVQFADGTYGYLKPTAQTEATTETHGNFGLTTTEATTHEVAAYHVAQAMGGDWPTMVPPTALVHDPDYGTASVQQHVGDTDMWATAGANADPEDDHRAQLFDAVIGNQDRHFGNIRTDEYGEQMWLIDHGFAFADETRVSDTRELDGEGRDALMELRAHPDGCGGVAGMIGPYRAAAMQARIDTILATGRF